MRRAIVLFFCTLCLAVTAEPWQAFLNEAEFVALGVELAPRVDLFAEIWAADPQAEIYGGTSRDFFWLLRAQFSRCTDRKCIERVRDRLRRQFFFAEELVAPESDVDVIAATMPDISLRDGLLTKIDVINPDWVKPGTWYAEQETLQGGLPVEKIRLTPTGILSPLAPALAGGAGEVYRGLPTLVFDRRITRTKLYDEKGNHPLLLVLRYLRQVASAYYHRYGRGNVDTALLQTVVDAPSWKAVETILAEIKREPGKLTPFLTNKKFNARIERVLKKLFRSFLNPNAARALFRKAGLDAIFEPYGTLAPQYQNVLFARTDDLAAIARARRAAKRLGVAVLSLAENTPQLEPGIGGANRAEDGASLLHATDTDANYHLICYQGILPSEDGSAGRGAYAVDADAKSFAYQWKRSDKARVVRLVFGNTATLLDYAALTTETVTRLARVLDVPENEDAIADALGADVVKYRYKQSPTGVAYVVKNGGAIARSEPFSDDVRSFTALQAEVAAHRREPKKFAVRFRRDPLLTQMFDALTDGWSVEDRFAWAREVHAYTPLAQMPYGIAYALTLRRANESFQAWMRVTLRIAEKDAPLSFMRCLLVFARLLPESDVTEALAALEAEKSKALARALQSDAVLLRDFAEFVRDMIVEGRVSKKTFARVGDYLHSVVLAHVATLEDPSPFDATLEAVERAVPWRKRTRGALRGSRLAGKPLPMDDLPRFFRTLFQSPEEHRDDLDFLLRQLLDGNRTPMDIPSPILPAVAVELAKAPESFRVPFWDAVFRRCVALERNCDDRRVGPIVSAFLPPKASAKDDPAVLETRGKVAKDILRNIALFDAPAREMILQRAEALLAANDPAAARAVETPLLSDYRHFLGGSSLRDPEEFLALYWRMLALATSPEAFLDGLRAAYEPLLLPGAHRNGFIGMVSRDMVIVDDMPDALREPATAYLRDVIRRAKDVFDAAERKHPGQGDYYSGYINIAKLQLRIPERFRVFDILELAAQPEYVEEFVRAVLLFEHSDTSNFRWQDAFDVLVGWSRVTEYDARFRDWYSTARYLLDLEKRAPVPPPRGWGKRLKKATQEMDPDHPLRRLIPELSRWPSPPKETCGTAIAG